MKIQPILTVFSIAISALFGYIVYSICGDGYADTQLLTILSAASAFLILFSGIGLKYGNPKSNTNIKVLSAVFSVISFVASLVMSFVSAGEAAIIIVSAAIVLIYLLILYLIPKSGI